MSGDELYYPGDIHSAIILDSCEPELVVVFGDPGFYIVDSRWSATRRRYASLRLVGNPFVEVPGAIIDISHLYGLARWVSFISSHDEADALATSETVARLASELGATRLITNWAWALKRQGIPPLFPVTYLPARFTAIDDAFTAPRHWRES